MVGDLELTSFKSDQTVKDRKSVFVSDDEVASIAIEETKNYDVQRQLKARHVSMIALGGAIGTGLFISTGGILENAGPVNSLISFLFIASLAVSVTQALGEMATYIPISGSFNQFVALWCSPAFGAACGYSYWFSWAITYALELSITGQVIQWWTDAVSLGGWIAIFFVITTVANLFPVKYYGEIEFWVASIKIIAVFGWIIYALCMVCGAGKTGPIGFRYWRNPGPWGPGILVSNVNTGRFLGWLSSLINSAFTFQGCELVGLSCGESKNPRKTVPAAIRKVLLRIMVFYIGSIFFIGMLIPYNAPELNGTKSYASSSPFLVAMEISGTKILPDIFNAVILITIISAANSNVYCGSRVLVALGQAKVGPRFFSLSSKRGVPYVAVIITAAFGLLAFMVLNNSGKTVFNWLLNITAVAGLIAWGWISFAHIRFMNILKHRNISRDDLPYKAYLMPFSSYYAAITILILVFIQGFQSFFGFSASKFFTSYISNLFFVVLWIGFHFYFNGFTRKAFTWRSLLIPIEDCDIDSGRREADEEIWEDEPPQNLWEKFWDVVA